MCYYEVIIFRDERYCAFASEIIRQELLALKAAGKPLVVSMGSVAASGGYWIAADQLRPLTVFHLYDRATLAPRGSFRGAVTAFTDGIALHLSPTPRFPGGAMYAVHDDSAVTAFDLRDVASALRLDPACTR